ncbi:MAG TPA: glycoside hydrolase family 28 protein [Lacipirellulaceae bacterium]|nr:glycoside hydrolase family 28 protein [Lacipirellulaceae bacterium]
MNQFRRRFWPRQALPGLLLLAGFLGGMIAAGSAHGQGVAQGPPWHMLDAILADIKPPSFPERDFPITAHGAVEGGKQDCREAVAKAIQACHSAGGGRVVVPAGKWLVAGPIHLKSHVNLHLAEGAHVLFSPTFSDYLPNVLARFEGTEVMNYSPLIYALDQENIAITGSGTLDGQASAENWWGWKTGGSDGDAGKLIAMADKGIPPEQRVFGAGYHLRVNFIQPYRCKNLLIEGVHIVRSPMWEINPVLCKNVTVRGVSISSHGPNNDGCNPESCNGVLIENCTFDTGDDCIAIKSGRNADGRRLATPSENIVIRGCTMKDGHGGVTLGSEMSGGIRNVFVEDCYMSSPNLDRAIRLKSNSRRGGYLENLFVRNIEVGEVKEAVLHIDLRYMKETGDFNPTVRNIYLENVSSKKSEHPLYLLGIEAAPIDNVVITNCRFENADKPSVLEFVDSLLLRNVTQPN